MWIVSNLVGDKANEIICVHLCCYAAGFALSIHATKLEMILTC